MILRISQNGTVHHKGILSISDSLSIPALLIYRAFRFAPTRNWKRARNRLSAYAVNEVVIRMKLSAPDPIGLIKFPG